MLLSPLSLSEHSLSTLTLKETHILEDPYAQIQKKEEGKHDQDFYKDLTSLHTYRYSSPESSDL